MWMHARTGQMRGKQLGFNDYEQLTAMKLSKREKLFVDMDQVGS